MPFFSRIGVLWQDFLAWRRGEKRITPRGVRGRIYARPVEPGGISARTEPKATIQLRSYRSEEGAWYRIDPDTGESRRE